MRRDAGILFGLATHGLFAVTVWYLYWFLKGPATVALCVAICGSMRRWLCSLSCRIASYCCQRCASV